MNNILVSYLTYNRERTFMNKISVSDLNYDRERTFMNKISVSDLRCNCYSMTGWKTWVSQTSALNDDGRAQSQQHQNYTALTLAKKGWFGVTVRVGGIYRWFLSGLKEFSIFCLPAASASSHTMTSLPTSPRAEPKGTIIHNRQYC